MANPLVSIVIPVYNGAKYLGEAIESALAQTYANCEIIVVNDGSTDDSEKIALRYGDKIRYFAKENGGVSTALNMAIENMHGEYFSWLSHDDVYYPYKIERQMEALRHSGDMMRIVWGNHASFDQKTGKTRFRDICESYSEDRLTDSVFPLLISCIAGCSLLIHKSHFMRVGLFKNELKFTQDYDLWFRMFYGQRTVFVRTPLYMARKHELQESTIKAEDQHRDEVKLYLDFSEKITREDKIRMFGSVYEYYLQLCRRLSNLNNNDAINAVRNMLKAELPPPEIFHFAEKVKNFLHEKSFCKKNKLCIFCAGNYGRALYNILCAINIKIDFFCDNDNDKTGKMIIDEIECLSFPAISAMKESTLIIVATKHSAAVMEQLRMERFPFVTTIQELKSAISSSAGDSNYLEWI